MTFEQGGGAASNPPGDRALRDDLDKLRADIASLRESLARVVSGVADQASRTVHGAAAQSSSTAQNLADSGLDLAAAAKDQAAGLVGELEAVARRNPLGALGGALLVGMVLGVLTRGRG